MPTSFINLNNDSQSATSGYWTWIATNT